MKKSKQHLISLLFIVLGSFILALGINMFLVPNKISSGGISTIGTMLLHLFNIKMSVTNLILNGVLFVLGFKFLGKIEVVKTLVGIGMLSLFLELTSYMPVFTEDMMISTIVGGALVGLGVGLVIRKGASTGGSDFLALILKRFIPHISLANIILVTDCIVIVVSGIVFKSFTITAFSVISMYISSKITDRIVTLGNSAKSIQIFSSKNDEISKHIMEKYERGASGIHCKGMYTKNESLMILCVVSPRELPLLVSDIRKIDKTAFIIISDAKEVIGEGFMQTY
jgi:uncharacterized membrane-anchored protein YitT (DUF2179 family)